MGKLNYYCYVSRFKVNQLYEQLTDFSIGETSLPNSADRERSQGASSVSLHKFMTGGVSLGRTESIVYEQNGSPTTVQKLKQVLKHINDNERVLNLNNILDKKLNHEIDTSWFFYKGAFKAQGLYSWNKESVSNFSKEHLIEPGVTENKFQETGPNRGSLVSGMCILQSEYAKHAIQLACSYKYFSEMGGNWDGEAKEWSVSPHSGNYHFFAGEVETTLEGLIFVNGITDDKIMGTPLFLIHSQDSKNYVSL
jgi:hypothetical protein